MGSKEAFYNWLKNNFPEEKKIENKIPFLNYENYSNNSVTGFVVYEDWWISSPQIVLSKVGAILGMNERIFARKTKVKRIDINECNSFLDANHIYGATMAKHKIGLFLGNELIAVATFSSQKNLNVGRSVELIRFCSKNNTTIVGGLDKLLKFYVNEFSPNHIMTYIDKDWGSGKGFLKLGFKQHSDRESITYYVNMRTGKRYRKQNKEESLLKVKNKGSLKIELFV